MMLNCKLQLFCILDVYALCISSEMIYGYIFCVLLNDYSLENYLPFVYFNFDIISSKIKIITFVLSTVINKF